jgi:hypothetical protein
MKEKEKIPQKIFRKKKELQVRMSVNPMAKVNMEESRKHHHFRSRRHSSSSGIWQ